MEQKNDNKKIEELTDEQLKEVSGGGKPHNCAPKFGCVKQDADCSCTECQAGLVLDSGKCKITDAADGKGTWGWPD